MRIGTTVKPKGEDEYDVDLVCELKADPSDFPNPIDLLDMVEERLRANQTYDGKIERKNRCIRINYANEFHMDILPACPSPSNFDFHGEHCLKVPDCTLEDWKDSNPKGYAKWFEGKARDATVEFRKSIEALPEQQAYEDLATLPRVVQLMKRNRDVILEDLDAKDRPISIVLTTLAAHYYNGSPSVIDALEYIVFNIRLHTVGTQRIKVLNPTNKEEDFSERWANDAKLYDTFVGWVDNLASSLEALRKTQGLPEIAAQLKVMFGENVTNFVVEDHLKRLTDLRKTGSVATTASGIIVLTETPKSNPIPYNTFHGNE